MATSRIFFETAQWQQSEQIIDRKGFAKIGPQRSFSLIEDNPVVSAPRLVKQAHRLSWRYRASAAPDERECQGKTLEGESLMSNFDV